MMPNLSYISPKAEVSESPIHGRGLFAREALRQGEVVCVKGGYVFGRETLRAMPDWYRAAEIQVAEDLFIGPLAEAEREGSMIFSNHSCDPNIGVRGQIVFVAMRAVAAGEELTHDWATTDDDDYELECQLRRGRLPPPHHRTGLAARGLAGEVQRLLLVPPRERGKFFPRRGRTLTLDTERHTPKRELLLTPADIRRAADEGVLPHGDAEAPHRLGLRTAFQRDAFAEGRSDPAPETRKGLNAVTVAYYFGAMLMISACAWFLGDKWEALGSRGVFVTVLVYMWRRARRSGSFLRSRGYPWAAASSSRSRSASSRCSSTRSKTCSGSGPRAPRRVCGVLPARARLVDSDGAGDDGAAALVALRYVPFGFLTAPLAHSFWFFSMDVAEWALRRATLKGPRAAG